jgi:hypothetical protein
MRIYKYSEARQNFSTVLNTALKEEVIITRKDGNRFKLISINNLAASHEVCCSHKVLDSGLIPLKRGKPRGVLNPRHE